MNDNNKPELTKEGFARQCYGIYKLKWMFEHGITLDEFVASIETYIQQHVLEDLPEDEYFDYIRFTQLKIAEPLKLWEALNIYGEDGKYLDSFQGRGFWKSFNMFLSTEFTDRHAMEQLLGGPESGLFATWKDIMKPEGTPDMPPTNTVYCERDCVNQENGYCIDCGVAIDGDGYCTGYQQR